MRRTFLLKTMLLLCALVAGSSSVWATDYSYTFETKVWSAAGAQTLNSVSWTMGGTGGSYFGYDGTKGQQFGSGTNPYSAVSLSTSGISGTITSVVVNTSGANSIAGTVAVSVGGTAFNCNSKTTASLTATATAYTFTGSASGDIVISWAQTSSKAIYVKSITVTYSNGGGGSDPSISLGSYSVNASEAEGAGTINVTYNNIADVEAEVLFYESDGTTPATYDWIGASINSAKNLYYNYQANTGAARTAYMKVHEKKTNVYSGLLTITQAAKTVVAPTFSPDGGKYAEGTAITITSAGNKIYYNLTTDGSTPADPTASSTPYTEAITLGVGTTKIKAIAYDGNNNASSITIRTFTGVSVASLPFNWIGGAKDDFTALAGVDGSGLGAYADTQAPYLIKFDGTGDYIVIYTNEQPVKVTMGVKMVGGSSTSKFKVQESADGSGEFTDVEELTISGSTNTIVNLATSDNPFASTTRVIKLLFEKGSNVGVGPISVFSADDVPVTISTATWASFSSNKALNFTGTGVTAYIAKYKDANNVTLTPIEKVPANTGIVVNASSNTYAIPVLTGVADATDGNLLQPWLTAGTPTETTYYTLAVDTNNNPKFKKSSGGTLAAGKSYLVLTSSAPQLSVDFGEGTTNLEAIRTQMEEVREGIFDLSGRRVENPTKGLYIVNGKKVVIK